MSAPFDTLLEVQEHDTHIDQLRHRRDTLADKAELAQIRSRLAALASHAATVQADRDEHGSRQEALEAQIDSSKARRTELQKRLFGGQVAAARELQAMDEEVRHLARHIGDLEDRELEVMEVLEPLDAALAEAEQQRQALDSRATALRQSAAADEAAIDGEIAAANELRAPLAAQVPADLLERYEKLRTKLGGTGAARLVGGSCGGCHLALPAMEVDRIKKQPPEAVITCDNCGRILVR